MMIGGLVASTEERTDVDSEGDGDSGYDQPARVTERSKQKTGETRMVFPVFAAGLTDLRFVRADRMVVFTAVDVNLSSQAVRGGVAVLDEEPMCDRRCEINEQNKPGEPTESAQGQKRCASIDMSALWAHRPHPSLFGWVDGVVKRCTSSEGPGSIAAAPGEARVTTILLVDDDPTVTSSVQRTLSAQAIDVIAVAGNGEAFQALRTYPVDLMLVDARHETVEGVSLIEAAQNSAQPVCTILMMAAATAREAEDALDRGVAGILDKPFSTDDLMRILERALHGESFRGDLSGVSLLDLFQVFNLSRRSLVVRVGGVPPARVWFENGEIVHAECGEEEGESVLERLVDVRTGAIRTMPFVPGPRTVDRLFHSLLLDILRSRDESKRVGSSPQEDDEPLELTDDDFRLDEPPVGAADEAEVVGVDSASPAPIPSPVWPSISDSVRLQPRRLDPICRAITAELPSVLATALIDLNSGALLGLHNTADFSPSFERFIALYTRALFRGPEIQYIERTVQEQRGLPLRLNFLEEVVLTSRHTHHLTTVIRDGTVALMVVTPRRVRVESTWPKLRALIPGVETNLG